jgi:hypothetical protein
LDLADQLSFAKKNEPSPKELHYIEELESEILILKKSPAKESATTFLEKVEKLITIGGGLFSLSEKILPILDNLKNFLD